MIVFLYLLFGGLSGLIEAVLYSLRGAEAFGRNEHSEMFLQRLSVALLPVAGAWLFKLTGSLEYVAFCLVPAALAFPLVHDEVYNFARLWIREAEKAGTVAGAVIGSFPTWVLRVLPISSADGRAFCRALHLFEYGYQSPTTTARNDFNGRQRTWLAVAAAAAWVAGGIWIL